MTIGGNAPMMPADALASMDMAWIFSAIFLRSRSTLERLPSASERLPPDFCWIEITMPKKFASGTGMRSNRRPQASPSGMPMAWVSMMAKNSLLRGSGESVATTLRDSNSGRPALMPRTITSTASGSDRRKAFSRRFLRKLSIQRGRPKPAANAMPTAPSGPPPASIAMKKAAAARMPETIMNFRGAQSRPACVRRADSVTFLSFSRRASSSFNDPSTCSRRVRWSFCVWRAATGSAFATDARRPSAFFCPESSGYRKTQAMPPMAAAARNARASVCIFIAVSSDLGFDFGGVERRGKPLFFAIVSCAFPEARPSDAGRVMPAKDFAVRVLADHVVEEQILGDDGVTFHPHHLGDVGDATGAVAQARGLNDDVDRRADHLANGPRRQRKAAHRDHPFAA